MCFGSFIHVIWHIRKVKDPLHATKGVEKKKKETRPTMDRRPNVKNVHTSWTRQYHVGVNRICGDLRDPSVVPAKGTAELHCFGHFKRWELKPRPSNERKCEKTRNSTRVQGKAKERKDATMKSGCDSRCTYAFRGYVTGRP